MDDGSREPIPPAGGLQFERAEFTGGAAPEAAGIACVACKRTIGAQYYEVDGKIVCDICRPGVEAALHGGSAVRRLFLASVAGTAAALLGALIYWAVLALTGYEFGLIAIVVGYLVGMAVRWGSQARGGWLYQGIAVALTYLSMAGATVPLIIKELRAHKEAAKTAATAASPAPAAAGTAPAVATPAADGSPAAPPSDAAPSPSAAAAADSDGADLPKPLRFAMAVALILALALAAPFLGGLENVIGIIILLIGLFEAWKLNRRHQLTITGPYQVGSAPAPADPRTAPASPPTVD